MTRGLLDLLGIMEQLVQQELLAQEVLPVLMGSLDLMGEPVRQAQLVTAAKLGSTELLDLQALLVHLVQLGLQELLVTQVLLEHQAQMVLQVPKVRLAPQVWWDLLATQDR